MTPFVRVQAAAASLPAPNVDTDQIVPSRFMNGITRTGLGKALFTDIHWFGSENSIVAQSSKTRVSAQVGILITGPNFGCGSSREHAVWALLDYGIRCLIGSSFADIFARNCEENGLLTIVLADHHLTALETAISSGDRTLTVDLAECTVSHSILAPIEFQVLPRVRSRLLAGLDTLGEALSNDDAVTKFEENYNSIKILF